MLNKFLKKEKPIIKDDKLNIKAMSGVLELKPAEQIEFSKMKKRIVETFEKFGFIPLDVATIERENVLLAKAGGDTEKEIYRIKKGDKDLALRFDLTVPLARYVAANYNDITFPFKRYQIGKVFRGERPQKGRFREFYQCDIDILGDGKLSIKNDAEIPSVIYSIFSKLNIGPFQILINNRKILAGLAAELNLSDKTSEVLRIIDKLKKIGEEKVSELLMVENISKEKTKQILQFVNFEGTNTEKIKFLKNQEISNEVYLEGIEELEIVSDYVKLFGIPDDYYKIDFSITRGLDYYTGTVYETFLVDYPELGSVCSGGRYDNLTEFYSKRKMPGVGISIGLSRLFSQLKDKDFFENKSMSISDVMILPLTDDLEKTIELATIFRRRGIKVEIFLEDQPIKKKFSYADKKGVEFVLVIGEDEIKSGKYTLKNMKSGEQKILPEDEIISFLLSLRSKNI